MSTEVLEKTKAVDLQPLAEWIEEEDLDLIIDEVMTAERLAHIVMVLRNRLKVFKSKVVDWTIKVNHHEYAIRVNNKYKGFVSVSNLDEGTTGVSYTEYYPYFVDEDDPNDFPALLSLASMINEAWYHCNN